jgi:hypothetical protein
MVNPVESPQARCDIGQANTSGLWRRARERLVAAATRIDDGNVQARIPQLTLNCDPSAFYQWSDTVSYSILNQGLE